MDLPEKLLSLSIDLISDLFIFLPIFVVCVFIAFVVVRTVRFLKRVRQRRKHKHPAYYSVREPELSVETV